MKLRNKKTGEIKEVIVGGYPVSGKTEIWECSEMDANEEDGYKSFGTYTSLAELNEEWEDYEEPLKPYWFINDLNGEPMQIDWQYCHKYNFREWAEQRKQIGNYFETKEESEKVVEKLKAWKRLKDKGYYFNGWNIDKLHFEIELRVKEYDFVTDEVKQDLDLLFGGEE